MPETRLPFQWKEESPMSRRVVNAQVELAQALAESTTMQLEDTLDFVQDSLALFYSLYMLAQRLGNDPVDTIRRIYKELRLP